MRSLISISLSPALLSMVSQVAQQPAQVQFRVSGLEAALQRGFDPALGLGVAYAFAKEIGIAAEILEPARAQSR